ncbi:LysE family translocator [Larsenimonas suaedae]|uniref:LysE family translocator n=1 Tax=Larsenimonas suaedae TaxID=1851019 RepID=A0ABU1GW27_9GAMM|nr:LysE family translocator [Larsenimonas suaedae]MCM2973357.1 LysE family translocator [Larsenimonas suaedae]MDR5896250.1 LysE family translocator [Larsenimonas suaedae]
MDLAIWLTYLSVITALIAFPGPVALLCMHQGVRVGRRRALASVTGGVTASLILMGLSALGLGAILATSELAFLALKVFGAGYLIYLGVQAWMSPSAPVDMAASDAPMPAASTGRRFRKGLGIGLSNPKDLLFFGALFPNFLDMSQPLWPQLTLLALTWLAVDFTTMTTYAALGGSISRWFKSARRVRLFNRTTGGLFIAAGGALAVSHR